jgi:hypothetical protein
VTNVDELDATAGDAPPVAGSAAYVYGVVRAAAAPRVEARGIGGSAVTTVAHRGVAALVSDATTPIRAKRRELLGHAAVLNEAVAATTVLPLRFGATFADRAAVVAELLEPRHAELTELLAELDGRVELLVKAYYREDVVLAEIVRGDPRIARLRALTRERPAAATHAERLELGTAVAGALAARAAADGAAILHELRPLALDARVDDTPVEHQVLRASFLVERARMAELDAAMSALAERHAGRIEFKYVGPLAPHSFVELEGAAWAS